MSSDYLVPTEKEALRATYEEYEVGDETIAMIADPTNEHAWIQSDLTQPIEL